MIASMTAFARKTVTESWGSLTFEVRAVNHRFLELSVRLPEAFRHLEKAIRDQVQRVIFRGKVEVNLKFQPGSDVPFDFVVNESLLQKLASAAEIVNGKFPNVTVSMTDLLTWQGVLDTQQKNVEKVNEAALALLQTTLQDMVSMRQREGNGLQEFILQRLLEVEAQANIIEQRLPLVQQQATDKILARFEDLSLEVEPARLEQEMLWLVQKSDVAEELQRLRAHVQEVQRVLSNGKVMGRRLDFLMQELNREANTLGSKSMDASVTQAVVELKVQIEQMREQVQNIE